MMPNKPFNHNDQDRPRVKVINGYQWGPVIGRGAWGKVRKVVQLESHTDCAVKIVYKCQLSRKIRNGISLFQEEFKLVKSLDHPNIVKYRELDEKSNSEKLYLFMELCAGNIHAMLPTGTGKLSFLKDKVRQVLLGLDYLASQNISHHDIKADNILISFDGTVKICDFGVAEKFDPASDGCKIFYGTPAYQGPEIAGNIDGAAYDGPKADIWSVGVLLYHLLCNELPWKGETVYLLLKSIDKDPLVIPTHIKGSLRDLLKKLFAKDPRQRPTAKQALQHSWFNDTVSEEAFTSQCCWPR